MRNESQDLSSALFTAVDDYGGLYFFRFLCFLISKTGNNNWLSVASIVLTMGPVYIVLIDYLRNEKYSTAAILVSLMLVFMGMQMPYVFSGIRNTIAVASSISAIYLIFYKRNHYYLAAVLCCMAVTTHQMILVLIPTVIVGIIDKHQWKLRMLALCAMPIIFTIAEALLRLPIEFLQQLAGRIVHYTDRAYGADRPEMIANILVFLTIAASHWLLGQEGVWFTLLSRQPLSERIALLVPFRSYLLAHQGYLDNIAAAAKDGTITALEKIRSFLYSYNWLILNVLLFIPYGILTSKLFTKKGSELFLCGIFIVAMIELAQYASRLGCLDIDDMIHNTIGIGIGFLSAKVLSSKQQAMRSGE